MVALRRESQMLAAGHFAVNVLHERQGRLAHRFARRASESWEGVGSSTGHGFASFDGLRSALVRGAVRGPGE